MDWFHIISVAHNTLLYPPAICQLPTKNTTQLSCLVTQSLALLLHHHNFTIGRKIRMKLTKVYKFITLKLFCLYPYAAYATCSRKNSFFRASAFSSHSIAFLWHHWHCPDAIACTLHDHLREIYKTSLRRYPLDLCRQIVIDEE